MLAAASSDTFVKEKQEIKEEKRDSVAATPVEKELHNEAVATLFEKELTQTEEILVTVAHTSQINSSTSEPQSLSHESATSEPHSTTEEEKEVSIHVSAETNGDVQLKVAVVDELTVVETKDKSKGKKRGKKNKDKSKPKPDQQTEAPFAGGSNKNKPHISEEIVSSPLEPVSPISGQMSEKPISNIEETIIKHSSERSQAMAPILTEESTEKEVLEEIEIPGDDESITDLALITKTENQQLKSVDPDEIVKTTTKTTILTQNTQVATVTRSIFHGDAQLSEPEVSTIVSHISMIGEEEKLQTEADGKKDIEIKQKIATLTTAPDQMHGTSLVTIQEIADDQQVQFGDDFETTSVTNVRTVVQQSSRRVVRKVKNIIRKIVIIDGKEQQIEEIVEEPEDSEFIESEVPQLSLYYTKEILPARDEKKEEDTTSPSQQEVSTQDETIDSSLARSISVPISDDTERSSVETTPRESEEHPSKGAVPKKKRKNKGRKGKDAIESQPTTTRSQSFETQEEDTTPSTPVEFEMDKSLSEQSSNSADTTEISTPASIAEEIKAPAVKIKISEGSPKVELEISTSLLQEQSASQQSDVKISCSFEEERESSPAVSVTELEPASQKSKKGKKGKSKVMVKSITSTVSISNGNHPEPKVAVVEVVEPQKSGKGKKSKGKQKQERVIVSSSEPIQSSQDEQQTSAAEDTVSESTSYEIHVQTTVTEETFQQPEPMQRTYSQVPSDDKGTVEITEIIDDADILPIYLGEPRAIISAAQSSKVIISEVEEETPTICVKLRPQGTVQNKAPVAEHPFKPTDEASEAKAQMSSILTKLAYKKMLPKESCSRRRSSLIGELPHESTEDCLTSVNEGLAALTTGEPNSESHRIRTITILHKISTWLEILEYQLHVIHESSDSNEKSAAINGIKGNANLIKNALATLQESSNLDKDGDNILGDQNEVKQCLESVNDQLGLVEDLTQESEAELANFNISWQELLANIDEAKIKYINGEAAFLAIKDAPVGDELLSQLENNQLENEALTQASKKIITKGRHLMKKYPHISIPLEIYEVAENSRNLCHKLAAEKEKMLQKIALTEEYKRTIDELAQIIEVAQVLVDSPLMVTDREQLQEEMQKHRKFFANLSHCQQLLESLDAKLDEESRGSHADLHRDLHSRASLILDKAAYKAQRMALAASRWTFLEQGLKEEAAWLKVVQQRVPELEEVSTTDYHKVISQYQV